jgi:hypothetical protein
MRKATMFALLFAISLVLVAHSPAVADYVLLKDVLSSAGGYVESSTYLLDFAVGQVAVGPSAGSEHIEWGGFLGWSVWGPAVAVETQSPDPLPGSHALHQNYPNPFNPITHISYQLPHADHITLFIYNVRGQLVRRLVEEYQPSGDHLVTWDATDDHGRPVASGMYFYHMVCGTYRQMRKMLLLK